MPDHTMPADLARAVNSVAALKTLNRSGWLRAGVPPSACETVAEHSFMTVMLALMLAGRSGVDPAKAALLAAVHDVAEARAGDITPHDGIGAEEKSRLEGEAMNELFDGIPEAGFIRELWEEYEAGITPEARFVKAADKLEMGLQACAYEKEGYPGMGEFLASAEGSVAGTALADILESSRE